MSIGKRMKDARISKGMTQQDVADRAGIGVVQYNGYERGRHLPSPRSVDKVAKALGLTAAQLNQPSNKAIIPAETFEDIENKLKTMVSSKLGISQNRVDVTITISDA